MSAFHDNALMGASGQQGYTISRSVRLRSSASAYFNRTPASAGNRKTWTWSGWVKRGALGGNSGMFSAVSGLETLDIAFEGNTGAAGDTLRFVYYTGSALNGNLVSTPVYRDPSAWYHVVAVWDTDNATASNRMRLYVNGVEITAFGTSSYPSSGTSALVNNTVAHSLGRYSNSSRYFDGYLTEINFIDGQALTPTSFGQFNSVTGVWQPIKYTGTYGTNGFYLNFSDNSNNTAATIGKDYSGNGNNWTPNNISVTSGATYDSMIDVPTPYADGGNGRGNYCVLNPLDFSSGTVSNGNTQWATTAAVGNGCFGSFAFDIADATNKYYWEMTITSGDGVFGIVPLTTLPSNTSRPGSYSYYTNGNKYSGTSASAYGSTFTSGDVIGVAVGNGSITFYKNNVSQGSAFTGLTGFFKPAIWEVSGTFQANFGQRPFTYTPPSGFNALNTQNLPSPTISNGALYMAATLYTGTSGNVTVSNAVNGISFQPDFLWVKARSNAQGHNQVDSVRGANKLLQSNLTNAESTLTNPPSFNSNGFTSTTDIHTNGYTYVAWQWQAGAGTTSSNTSGSITSTVSVNATAGFSVVTYTGTGANATVGHGLGVAPSMIILKPRNAADNWPVWHSSFAVNEYVYLNLTNAKASLSTFMNGTLPSSTVISLGTWANTNTNTQTMVAYCFSAVRGYSAFGSYTGNGSATGDGPFVYLGFRPRFVMLKITTTAGYYWMIKDSSRDPYNTTSHELYANVSDAEYTASSYQLDFLSNGFKIKNSGQAYNGSGDTYIYAAFAENPLKFSLAR